MDKETKTKTDAVINTLVAQRNDAMNAIANLSGELSLKDIRIAELESQLEESKPEKITTTTT